MSPAAYMLIFILGVAVVVFTGFPAFLFKVLALGLMLGIPLVFLKKEFLLLSVALLLFLSGMLRGTLGPLPLPFLEPVSGRLETVRDSFVQHIAAILPEPQSSFIAGLLVGGKSLLPRDLKTALGRTGTSHIVALSGYNVTIIANYISLIFRSPVFSIVAILTFVLATGASSSVVRAGIMGSVFFLSERYGTFYKAKDALLFAVLLMVFVHPDIMAEDIGFQLSVLATMGLLYLTRVITPYLSFIPECFNLKKIAGETLAAEAATLPLVLFYFGFFSPLAPLVNLLILPLIPATMLFGFIAGLGAYAHNLFGIFLAWPAYLLTRWELGLIQFFANIHVF